MADVAIRNPSAWRAGVVAPYGRAYTYRAITSGAAVRSAKMQ